MNVFEQPAKKNGDDPVSRILGVLQKLIETEGCQFESTTIADEVMNPGLFSNDDEI